MNSFTKFFTETIPSFAQNNWLVLELVFFALTVLFLILFMVALVLKKKANKNSTEQIMTWVSKNTEKSKQLEKKETEYKELNEKYIESIANCKRLEDSNLEKCETLQRESSEKIENLEKDLNVCKECLSESERNLAISKQECLDKNAKIADMTIERDNLVKELNEFRSSLEGANITIEDYKEEIETLSDSFDTLKSANTELNSEYDELRIKNANTERTLVELSENHKELKARYNEALKEIDFLKNYELENEVLLKTLRKFKEDDNDSHSDMKDAIVDLEKRLNNKIEATFETMTARVISAAAKNADIDWDGLKEMKRSQLSKIARELGIKNYATWSNERLAEEIKKYK